MYLLLILSHLFLIPGFSFLEHKDNEKKSTQQPAGPFGTITITCSSDASTICVVDCSELYREGLDTIRKTVFWRTIMNTDHDSVLFYSFPNRRILGKLPYDDFSKSGETQQAATLEKFSSELLEGEEKVSYMRGRNHFYDVPAVVPQIDRAVKIFEQQNVDPFYAQAILLIESPGKLAKSSVGAFGPFQLMKSVARQYGLKVNAQVDERSDFNKSAIAASKLISRICIPYTNAMLRKRNIAWCETDLWYRLLVLHVYHAGAGNVAKAIDKIEPEVGSINLIKTLWKTNAGGFQNASQNYSQVAIASLIELDNHIQKISSPELP